MRVRETMSKGATFIKPEQTLKEAAQMMRENDCGYLPVGENDRLIGAITDRDIAVRAVAEGRDPGVTRVRDVMTSRIKYCYEADDLEEAARKMAEHRIRRLVVLDEGKRLTGVITIGDIATRYGDNKKLLSIIESEVCKKAA